MLARRRYFSYNNNGRKCISTPSQYNPGFICGRINDAKSGGSSGAVTQWSSKKCEKGYFCIQGVKAKCRASCPKGNYVKAPCNSTADLLCAPAPRCSERTFK